jgi:hypothetical protein
MGSGTVGAFVLNLKLSMCNVRYQRGASSSPNESSAPAMMAATRLCSISMSCPNAAAPTVSFRSKRFKLRTAWATMITMPAANTPRNGKLAFKSNDQLAFVIPEKRERKKPLVTHVSDKGKGEVRDGENSQWARTFVFGVHQPHVHPLAQQRHHDQHARDNVKQANAFLTWIRPCIGRSTQASRHQGRQIRKYGTQGCVKHQHPRHQRAFVAQVPLEWMAAQNERDNLPFFTEPVTKRVSGAYLFFVGQRFPPVKALGPYKTQSRRHKIQPRRHLTDEIVVLYPLQLFFFAFKS